MNMDDIKLFANDGKKTGEFYKNNKNMLPRYHHHHHVALVARISLSLSRHSSLSFIRTTSRILT